MPSKQYPFIDIAVHEGVRARFAAGEALVLFSDDMEKVLWANGAGSGLFGQDFIYDFIDAGLPSSDVTTRQIKATAGQLQKIGDKRSFLMRITTNFQRVTIQANLELLNDRGGDQVILFSAATSEKPLPLAQRAQLMLSGFDDPDTHMAVLAADGTVLASSPDFSNLAMTQETLLAFVKAVSRDADQLLKRPVPTGRGYLPAAIGKLSDDPALHLLFCVETAIGQMDPTNDETFAETYPNIIADDVAVPQQQVAVSESDLSAENSSELLHQQRSQIAFDDALDAVSHIEDAPDEPTEQGDIVEADVEGTKAIAEDRSLATGLQMLNGPLEDDMSLSYANETADDLADLTALHALDSTPYGGVPDAHAFPNGFEADYQAFSTNEMPLAPNDSATLPLTTDTSLEVGDILQMEGHEVSSGNQPVPSVQIDPIESLDGGITDPAEPAPTESALFAATPDQAEIYEYSQATILEETQQVSVTSASEEIDKEFIPDDTAQDSADATVSTEAEANPTVAPELLIMGVAEVLENDLPLEPAAVVETESSQNSNEQELTERVTETAIHSEQNASETTPSPAPSFHFERNSRPVRFVWKVDASGKFSEISEEFAQAVGPRAAAINDLYFSDVARAFKMDPDGKIGDLLQKRDTWSGKTIYWPVEGTTLKVPVDLAALPTYSRSRSFDGFRGFGIVRLVDAIEDPDEIGTTLGKQSEAPAAAPVTEAFAQEEPASTVTVPFGSPAMDEEPSIASLETENEIADGSATLSDIRPPAENLKTDESAAAVEIEQTKAAETDGAILSESPSEVSAEEIEPVTLPLDIEPASGPVEVIETIDGAAEETVSDGGSSLQSVYDAELAPESSSVPTEGTDSSDQQPTDVSVPTDVLTSETNEPELEIVQFADVEHADIEKKDLPEAEVAAETSVHADTETTDAQTSATDDESKALTNNDTHFPTSLDDFQGEKPALRIVETPGRRHSDKVISIDAHRGKSREGLSLSEQAAFQEIARQLDPLGKRLPEDSQKNQPTRFEGLPAPKREIDAGQNANDDGQKPAPAAELDSPLNPVLPDEVAALIPSRTKSEEQLSAGFVDSLPLAILVHTGENLIHANPEFFRLTGYESLQQLKDFGGLDALLERDQAPRTSDEAPAMLMVTAHGTLEPVTARLQSIRWEESHALLLALVPKRTDSEREAAAKVASENRVDDPEAKIKALTIEVDELRSILETATDGVVIVGQDGDIRSMNKSASALFNFDDEDTRGKSFAMLFAHESQKAVMDYLAGLSGHGVASVLNDGREVIGREASGGFIPLFMTMGRLSSSNGYCAVIRDITQWKRTEEELRTAKRAAETANAHKSEFLARVSHEIRTPLNAIIGFSDMMATERLGPIGHPRYVEYSDDIGRSGRHVLDIVNDLLDISKIEAGEMDLEFTAVELNEAVSEAVSLVQPQVNSQRVIIRTSLSQSVPNIVADQRSIKQIAINILANAIRYTPSGGQIVVSTAYESNGSVVLRIRDTGVGMTRTELEQALKPFRQVTTGSRKRGDGTGLGLPLTKAMVDANRANFAISSAPNEGTLVEITFPSPRVLAN